MGNAVWMEISLAPAIVPPAEPSPKIEGEPQRRVCKSAGEASPPENRRSRYQAERVRDLDELDRLRAVAAERVRATEFTALTEILCRADSLGGRSVGGSAMSPAELRRFLFEFAPPARNKRSNHTTFESPVRDERGGETVALGVLVRDLPPERRQEAIVVLLGAIGSLHREAGVSLPIWFADAAHTTVPDEPSKWVSRQELTASPPRPGGRATKPRGNSR